MGRNETGIGGDLQKKLLWAEEKKKEEERRRQRNSVSSRFPDGNKRV